MRTTTEPVAGFNDVRIGALRVGCGSVIRVPESPTRAVRPATTASDPARGPVTVHSRAPDSPGPVHASFRGRAAPSPRGVQRGSSRERGSVTAEIAVALPALMIVLAVALWGVTAAAAQVACVDAARTGARAAARGESPAAVRTAVLKAAPPGARVTLTHNPLTTHVTVHAAIQPPIRALFPPLQLRSDAAAATEPTGGGAPPPQPETAPEKG